MKCEKVSGTNTNKDSRDYNNMVETQLLITNEIAEYCRTNTG